MLVVNKSMISILKNAIVLGVTVLSVGVPATIALAQTHPSPEQWNYCDRMYGNDFNAFMTCLKSFERQGSSSPSQNVQRSGWTRQQCLDYYQKLINEAYANNRTPGVSVLSGQQQCFGIPE